MCLREEGGGGRESREDISKEREIKTEGGIENQRERDREREGVGDSEGKREN